MAQCSNTGTGMESTGTSPLVLCHLPAPSWGLQDPATSQECPKIPPLSPEDESCDSGSGTLLRPWCWARGQGCSGAVPGTLAGWGPRNWKRGMMSPATFPSL